MQNRRNERVRELLRRELSTILMREFPISEAGVISVLEVVLSADLHSATVYVSIVGSPEQQRKGLSLLQGDRKRIQGMIAHSVILKYTPQLRFEVDDSVARGNRVMQIIEDIERTLPPESE